MDTRPPPGFVMQGSETPPPPPGFVMKDTPDLPPAELGAGARFMAGVEDPVVGGSQLLTHIGGSEEAAQKADEAVREREAKLQAGGMQSGDLMRAGGRMVGTLPAMAVAGPIGGLSGVAGAAVGGALSEAVQPVADKDYWSQKGLDTLMGAAFGGVGGMTAKVVGPSVKEAPKALMAGGVQLTPGQIMGGFGRRTEEALKIVPGLSGFVRSAENRSLESFNISTINSALEPIGVQIPKNIKAGHEAMGAAKTVLTNAYDNLLPQMQLTMDQNLASDIANARFRASSAVTKDRAAQFDKILEDRLQRHFNNTGSIPGDELKKVESELNAVASQYRASSDGDQRALAALIDDVRGSVRDALSRQNPQHAPELEKINHAYAMFARVEEAATRRATSSAVFTPSDLLQAIKSGDKSVRKGSFARGDALMQEWAEFAQKVLPAKMADSGTPERLGYAATAANLGAWLHNPLIPAGMAAGVAPYTKLGQAAVNRIAQPGTVRKTVGKAAPYIGTAIEPYLKTLTE